MVWVSSAAAQEKNADAKAKGIVNDLVKAIEAKDLDAAMKLFDVPFILVDKGLFKDEKELRKTFGKLLDSSNKVGKPKKEEVEEVWTYPQFREKYKDNIEKNKDLVGQLDVLKLTADDRVVFKPLLGMILVRIREGKPRIVGALGE
jgi:hypothetical protein